MQNYLRQIILPPTFLCFNKKFENLWHLFIQSWNICWTKKGLFAFLHERLLEIKLIRKDTRWELSWKIIFLSDKEMWVRGIRLSLVQFIISMWTKAGQSTEGTGNVISLNVPDPVLVPGVHLLSFSGNWKLQQKCFAVLLSKPRNKKIKYDPELRIVNWL